MVNLALALAHHPPSHTATSLPSLRPQSPPHLGPEAPREATPPLDHTYPLRSGMYPTKSCSALPYGEAALPLLGRIPRAGVLHLRVITDPRRLNTADLVLVSFICSPRIWPRIEISPRSALSDPFSRCTIPIYPHELTYRLLCVSSPRDTLCGPLATAFPFRISLPQKDAVTSCSENQQHLDGHRDDKQCWKYVYPLFPINSRKPDLLVSQIPHPTHDLTLRSTNHPASTCILSSPIHVSIMPPSSTTWAGLRQPGPFWTAPLILRFLPTPLPSLLAIRQPRHPINSFSDHTNSHGRSS